MLMAEKPPFELERIDHVLLLVRDMDGAIRFYRDVLGCTLEHQLPEYAMAELRAGASHIDLVDISSGHGLWATPERAGGRNVDHICLSLLNCEETALRAHLAAHRVAVVEERTDQDVHGRSLSLYVRDPSENMVQLMTRSKNH